MPIESHKSSALRAGLKELFFFSLIAAFVLAVNASIISWDLMYPEQPLIYIANQQIHSLRDLFNIYSHPKMLDIFSIPFFRPSGHFLIYQILTPLLGWHNTRALLIVNFLFLAGIGYLLLKLYALLFPGYKIGGYIAFGIYLMHPSLILSRLILLHFEFAYIFFTLLSVYCFALFCSRARTTSYSLLAGALLCYGISITFKEPALMLGPVLALYYCFSIDRGDTTLRTFLYRLFCRSQNLEIIATLGIITLSAAIYLTLPWPNLNFKHPLAAVITSKERIAALQEFARIIFAIPTHFASFKTIYHPQMTWRILVFPTPLCFVMWMFYGLLGLTSVLLIARGKNTAIKKSLLFLGCSALLFMILPIQWSLGLPWHISLTLLFLSMMLGFSGEYFFRSLLPNHPKTIQCMGMTIAVLLGLSTWYVNRVNINELVSHYGFELAVSRNAVWHPPTMKQAFSPESLLVVEDSTIHNPYALGNSGYTYYTIGNFDFDALQKILDLSFLKFEPLYNGTLFTWAYALPFLQEEVHPFDVHQMRTVPDALIYHWLQHYHNIFCVGYDKQANWHDRTAIFKKNLLREKTDRFMHMHPYTLYAATTLKGTVLYTKKVSFPDHQICQHECDQNIQCKGFTYEAIQVQLHSRVQCEFYDSLKNNVPAFCPTCIGFVKQTEISI